VYAYDISFKLTAFIPAPVYYNLGRSRISIMRDEKTKPTDTNRTNAINAMAD